jgi:cytochrome c-type biogenesis protein CcmF
MLGQERVVDATYYERAAGPLLAALLALMAAGPLLPWRRAGAPWLRALAWPAGGAVATLLGLLAFGVSSAAALIALPLAVAAGVTCMVEYGRAVRKRRLGLFLKRRRRYGAYLAHIGLVVVAVGIAASHFWQQEADVTLQPGEHVSVFGSAFTYTGSEQRQLGDHSELVAVMRFGDKTLEPSRATYAGLGGQALTHVAITTTPLADVYVILVGSSPDGSASFRILINPLVSWIWAGGSLLLLGVAFGNLGARRPETVAVVTRPAVVASWR